MGYMKKLIICLVLFLTLGLNLQAKKHDPMDKVKNFYLNRTHQYYLRYNKSSRKKEEFAPYMDSAFRVAKMMPIYPARDEVDRAIKLFSFGKKETDYYQYNNVVFNVPGAYYGRLKVREFSVDFSWVQNNSENINRYYEVAKAIQDLRPIPKRLIFNRALAQDLYEYCYIPQSVYLQKPPMEIVRKSLDEYRFMKNFGYSPNEIRSILKKKYRYYETTGDQLDSDLIIRTLIELERCYNDKYYGEYDKKFYIYLIGR